MTEKRFTLKGLIEGVPNICDNGEIIEQEEAVILLNELHNENEQLKQSSTMYYNLFKELQRQMQGVKSIYDLDSKDFEDLIELSKGNVFTDEIGWIHLPIKELKE